jgi:hypothetical protein
MGELFLAQAEGPGGFSRLLALKQLRAEHVDQAPFVDMFLDEARIAATLNHANIVQIFDLGHEGNTVYMAMEYLHGHDLREVGRRSGAMGIEPSVAIGLALCAALQHAHEQRGPGGRSLELVHRDISPHNVVVTYDGQVKLIDFGIAHARDKLSRTRSGVVLGKLGYMSPEQCRSRPVDGRSDLFSLSVVLWELLLGRPLFDANTEYELMRQIVESTGRPVRETDPSLPRELEQLLSRGIARPVSERWQSAAELRAALEAFALAKHLDVSQHRLARDMEHLFRPELDAWRAAQREGCTLADHLVALHQPRHGAAALDGPATRTASPQEPLQVKAARGQPALWIAVACGALLLCAALLHARDWRTVARDRTPIGSTGIAPAPIASTVPDPLTRADSFARSDPEHVAPPGATAPSRRRSRPARSHAVAVDLDAPLPH